VSAFRRTVAGLVFQEKSHTAGRDTDTRGRAFTKARRDAS
jgi:hypothetical protein